MCRLLLEHYWQPLYSNRPGYKENAHGWYIVRDHEGNIGTALWNGRSFSDKESVVFHANCKLGHIVYWQKMYDGYLEEFFLHCEMHYDLKEYETEDVEDFNT